MMSEMKSVEQMCRELLRSAIDSGLVEVQPRKWGYMDPMEFNNADLAGMADTLRNFFMAVERERHRREAIGKD